MSEIKEESLHPLPAPLPEGERVLWQRSPVWQAFARRVFHSYKIALYFLLIIAWVAISAGSGGGWSDAGRSLLWTIPPALAVVLLLAFLAWLYARTTVYTITNKRVIVQSGLAFTTAVNLPFSKLDRADMQTFDDGTGDIELTMSGPRILYSMIWPNNRLFALKRPVPILWALPNPHRAAEVLGEALAVEQQPTTELGAITSDQKPRLHRATTP
ncbi:MAG: photosynthetic complex putative assembly protein PuhB [Wenzhouxiangella sp.]|nr:photosynthetic complex putative assembly protein PuhB [Wenzhouxiangella sp.]